MAYNTATAPAAGKTLAFDGDFPRSALVHGAEGAKVDASAANPLPVVVDAIGEVSATPTANTVLARLKAIADGVTALSGNVDGLEALATALNGFVDGIEALIGTTNSTLTAVGGYVDGLEALQGTTNTTLTTLSGFVDGLETLLADNLTTAAFQARIPTNGPKAASGSVPVTLSNDQDPVLDHVNAVIASVTTTSSTALTPPSGSRFGIFMPSVDMFVRTDGSAASATLPGSLKLLANVPRELPITGGTAVTAIVATGTGELRVTPTKSRT